MSKWETDSQDWCNTYCNIILLILRALSLITVLSGEKNIFLLQYNIACPVNDDCEEEDEEDEDYPSKKKDDFDSDDPVERRCFSFL